ncbi:MAG: hypothetical protein ABIF77_13325 [bacterium]
MSTKRNNPRDWQPPFCPNPNCQFHRDISSGWQYKKIGFFHRLAPPHRIQRYFCKHCRVSFSRQTFSTTYYLKRPDLLARIFMKTVGGMANRQIARDLVVDGFESFEYSQYFPIHHHLAVDTETSFFIYFTDSELRRKGRM